MCKTLHSRTHFGSSDVEKLQAAVAGSAFASQNVKKLRGMDHFLKLWGHLRFAQLLEVSLRKWTN